MNKEKIKTFNEYFGGGAEAGRDMSMDRSTQLIEYLKDFQSRLHGKGGYVTDDEMTRVDKAWSHVVHNISLETLAKGSRIAKEVRGDGETITQKVKRSIRDF